MSLKSWVADHVHRMNGLVSRADLQPLASPLGEPPPPARAGDGALSNAEHLGVYGPLIKAVRDELEHFIVSQLRLHLAIADRDRFVLTSIGVRCNGADEARERLRRFMREFKPEQVKRYLAREVIAGLPNAAAIDLSQFAGLVDVDMQDDEADDYRELLAELAGPQPEHPDIGYEVSLLGRWSELDAWPVTGTGPAHGLHAAGPAPHAQSTSAATHPTPLTPLAGQRCEFDLEDADGRRRIVLQSVVPGRRYVIGKGEGCDICVSGTYTSRRHAEIWMEHGGWWVGDAGSTNGIRVEPVGVPGENGENGVRQINGGAGDAPIRVCDGARVVLSARSEGPAGDFPWLSLRGGQSTASRLTPIASTVPKTPLTAIRPAQETGPLAITTTQGSDTQVVELRADRLPVAVGRSRNQTVVIDRRHDAVSGHHLDIVALDEGSAQVVVHGDNGVIVDGMPYASGACLQWKPGQAMVLGASADDAGACTLMLQRLPGQRP
ncbi:MAG TPA: FHA domain-containing protein [Burkholderiaceae bacterium]|nr:FHA domain-containing protein [Burkholderiaceae bacterium]